MFRHKLLCGLPLLVLCAVILWGGVSSRTEVLATTTTTTSTDSGTSTDTSTQKNGWVTVGSKTYYYVNGVKVTGLYKIKKHYYYFNEKGVMKTGWITIGSKTYYFKSNGRAVTNKVKKIDGYYYYFNKKGVMKTGFRTVNGKKYYFQKTEENKGQALTDTFIKIKGNYYWFNKKGVAKTGWQTIDGDTYFFYKHGKKMGRAATGTVKIGKKVYSFDSKGVRYTGQKADMNAVAYYKSSKTKYLVLVDKSAFKVAVYKGSQYNWTMIKYFTCTIGASGTETVEGTFKMGAGTSRAFKMIYFDADGGFRCWYATRITGGYLFHSVLYWPSSSPSSAYIANGTLGAKLSHGCVRLAIKDAKWMHKKMIKYTTCYIYS
ncbi:MAG: L,D-transpeptidase family protein [Eubacterium sp.]|nr:L,D-transpeptidase family protein [Eubacterium sp.]